MSQWSLAESAREAARELIALDGEVGARFAAPVMVGVVNELAPLWRLVRANHTEVGDETCAAVAELLSVAGWIAFDAERQQWAQTLNHQALRLTRRCGDRATEHLVLLTLSMRAAHLGRPRSAHRYAEEGLAGTPPTPRAQAPFLLRQARAFALAGQRREALRALDHARSLFADGPCDRDPRWAWWLDSYELIGHQGWAHAALHDWRRAIPLLQEAVQAPHAPAYRAVFTAELLRCLVHAAAWPEAGALLATLLAQPPRTGSGRAARSLRSTVSALDLAAVHRGRRTPPAVREAAHHLGDQLR